MDFPSKDTNYRSRNDFFQYNDILESGRNPINVKNERHHKRRKMSRDRRDTRLYDHFSIGALTTDGVVILPEEGVLDTTDTYNRIDYEGYSKKELVKMTSVYRSDHIDEGTMSRRVDRRETRLTYEYQTSRIRQLQLQLKEAQGRLRATMRKTESLSGSLLDTQAELTRVYEQRDSYMNDVHDLRDEVAQMEAQLEEVETRNYSLTKDYETLERDNACLRRYSDELSKALQGTLSQKDRRDLHHIRRRILVEKATEVLKRRYCDSYPFRLSNESFHSWSKRVGYPGWERISSMVMDAKYHGNRSAHEATQAEMLQTVTLALEDDLELGDTGEGEVLRDMYNIVYSGPG